MAYVSYIRHNALARLEATDSGRAVKGVKLCDLLKILNLFLTENRGLTELLASVCEAVTYRADLIGRRDHSELSIAKKLKHELDRRLMIREGLISGVIFLSGTLVCDNSVDADSLTITLGKNIVGVLRLSNESAVVFLLALE